MMISDNFSRKEFACKCGCGFDTVDSELLKILQWLREEVNVPVTITSGCRCVKHNKLIGGVYGSQHTLGRATDIQVYGYKPGYIYGLLDVAFRDKISLGLYDSFVHIDTRTDSGRRW